MLLPKAHCAFSPHQVHLNIHSSVMPLTASRKKKIQKELEDRQSLEACAARFGLLGDATRIKICWLLCHHKELSVGDIAALLDVSVSTVSHALKKLREGRVVEARKERKRVFYRLARTDFTGIIRHSLKSA